MLNTVWACMILFGIGIGAATGNLEAVTNGSLESAKEAVTVSLSTLGVISMWTGLMKVAEKAGMIEGISKKMRPLLIWLFPELPPKSKAMDHIATNMIANVLGLGSAATPAGLKAMEEMQKYNPDKSTATRSMCMFMIVNLSSLQLVTMNIIAYRSEYGSMNPTEIIGPGIAATLVSTVVAVIFTKLMERRIYK